MPRTHPQGWVLGNRTRSSRDYAANPCFCSRFPMCFSKKAKTLSGYLPKLVVAILKRCVVFSTQIISLSLVPSMSKVFCASSGLLGERDLSYGPGQSLLTTIDLPVSYHITHATAAEPYLGIMLKFDMSLITQVASKFEAVRPGKTGIFEPIWIQRLDAPMLDALHRLLSLLDEPTLIPQLAPLIQQEIIVRLLTGPHAPHLWRLVNAPGPTQQIAKAVAWIRQNFAEKMRVEELAKHTNMSPTTFRQHFRTITGMSPVQFQLLRLQEARQLMLDQHMTRRHRERRRRVREHFSVQP